MFLDVTVGVTTSFSQPLRPWFDVKSCGESIEVGAMVIYTDILIYSGLSVLDRALYLNRGQLKLFAESITYFSAVSRSINAPIKERDDIG